ncbi:MAG: hypothetical protein ACWA6X_10025 [Bauldia sp.]
MAIDTRFTEPRSDQYARPMHVETAREARQGPLGRPILYVLIGGLALAAVYLIGTMIWSGSEDLPPAGQVQETTVPPPAVNMTPADPVVIPAPAATPAPAPVTPTPVTPAPVTPAG